MSVIKSGYGLMYKGELLGYRSEDSCCSVGTIYALDNGTENVWIVDDKLTASFVRMVNTEWYAAGYDTPQNPFKPEDLEVVEITVSAKPVEPDRIPTYEEFIDKKYNTRGLKSYNPQWAKHIMEQRNRSGVHNGTYDGMLLCDLQLTMDEIGRKEKKKNKRGEKK